MERIERDLLGAKVIPANCYYGIHTLRALENFPLTGRKTHPEIIKAGAVVKKAAATANYQVGLLDGERYQAISLACEEISAGEFLDSFPLDPLQGGAGTSTNMNLNEVIANRAIERLGGVKGDYQLVHPLDHVNLSQSTNDVYPTAVRIAAIRLLKPLSAALAELQEALQHKESEFAGVIKVGRTQLQDALPVMLGQEFGAFAQSVARDRWRLYKAEERLRQVNIGGTAVGTGMNAPLKYIYLVTETLRELTGLGLARAEYPMDITQNADVFVEVSGWLKAAAVNLSKIANDIRLLASGPRSGLGEINLEPVQAGSSIMPGKVNPVIPEAVNQGAYQVLAHDLAITLGAQAGQLELNALLPLIADNFLAALDLLRNTAIIFKEKCIIKIKANQAHCLKLLEESLVTATALVPHLGYEKATEIAQIAYRNRQTIKEVVLESKIMSPEDLQQIMNPLELTAPGIPGRKR